MTAPMHRHGSFPVSSSVVSSAAVTPSQQSSFSHAIPLSPITAHLQSGDAAVVMAGRQLERVRLSDIVPYEGAPAPPYVRAVETLSSSLTRHNAAVIELGGEETALMRCGLEASRLYFRTRAQSVAGKGSRGLCMYRAGRSLEDLDASPPCMVEIFRCMGKAARASLSAIARHLRLRSDVFNHLLDDHPLPPNEASSSILVVSYSHPSTRTGKGAIGIGKASINGETEKGLLTLICSDSPGLQVCDPNGRWFLADTGCGPGDLLLITGKALSHATAGLRLAALHRASPDIPSSTSTAGRIALAFRLMPQSNAILDCSPIEEAGHLVPQRYVPISVSQFMDDLSAEDEGLSTPTDRHNVARNDLTKEPSLRSVLSDPISGAFLDDAMVVSCGHSFGGLMLRKVIETSRCTLCSSDIEIGNLIPNLALRAAAAAVKQQDDKRLFHNAAMRRRRREVSHQMALVATRENGDTTIDDGWHRAVQYPFAVDEKVLIKGNRRTPEKFVGKEAIVTSQCLNGWYLLRIVDSGENVRLQYRSLRKLSSLNSTEDMSLQLVENSS